MATKNNPGEFDCYENADPDEPMFVLLGRDPAAFCAVVLWIKLRIAMGKNKPDDAKILEAKTCGQKMEDWAIKLGKTEELDRAVEAFQALICFMNL